MKFKLKFPPNGAKSYRRLFVLMGVLCSLLQSALAQSGATANINYGNLPAPSSKTLIKDLGTFGKIVRSQWTGSNTIGGTEQTIHVAELDFSKNVNDYELKVVYVYNDPVTGNPIDPAECREFCYYIPCTGGPECINGFQRFCEPIPGKQFDFVSHLAAKYGAIMATNGSFYDYFYGCVPGVKSFVKTDGQVKSFPNVLNHRNEGAFAFDFSGSVPKMKFFRRQANTLEALDPKNETILYGGDVASYPNVMSGGHIVLNGAPYVLSTPSFCNGITYPWSNNPDYTGSNDILGNNVPASRWRQFACPTLPSSTEYYKALTPTAYGYQNFFKCSNLGDLAKRKQLTCIDYAKYGEEFGGSNGLAKRSRTFLAKRGSKFYWFVADGCIDQVSTSTGPARCKGFTIEELGEFAQRMGLDTLLNLDGGSSSTFYVNGRGILQFKYDANPTPDKKQIGPQGQRLLQCVLMLVPKQRNLNSVYAGLKTSAPEGFVRITNSTVSGNPADAFVDLSPNITTMNAKYPRFISGEFAVKRLGSSTTPINDRVGQILFGYTENTTAGLTNAVIAGVGPIPAPLRGVIVRLPKQNASDKNYDNFYDALAQNDFAAWSIVIKNGVVRAAGFERLAAHPIHDEFKRSILLSLVDGQWHSFFMSRGGEYSNSNQFERLHFFIDRQELSESFDLDVSTGTNPRLFEMPATNFLLGAVMVNGVTFASSNGVVSLDVKDLVFSSSYNNITELLGMVSSSGGFSNSEQIKNINLGLLSADINSNLQSVGHKDFDFVFPFDEPDATKEIAYSWKQQSAGTGRRIQYNRGQTGYATLIGNTIFTNDSRTAPQQPKYIQTNDLTAHLSSDGVHLGETVGGWRYILSRLLQAGRKKRSIDEPTTSQTQPQNSTRPLVNIVNKKIGKKLFLRYDLLVENNQLIGQDKVSATLVDRNVNPANAKEDDDLLIEMVDLQSFLISAPGKFSMAGAVTNSRTSVFPKAFTPKDLNNYWELIPVIDDQAYMYIKHKITGKYLAEENNNVVLKSFTNPSDPSFQWGAEVSGKTDGIIPSMLYSVKVDGDKSKFLARDLSDGKLKIKDNSSFSSSQNRAKFYLDYVGAGMYIVSDSLTAESIFFGFQDPTPGPVNIISLNWSDLYPLQTYYGLHRNLVAVKSVAGLNPSESATAFQFYSYFASTTISSVNAATDMSPDPWYFSWYNQRLELFRYQNSLVATLNPNDTYVQWVLLPVGEGSFSFPGSVPGGVHKIVNLAEPDKELSATNNGFYSNTSSPQNAWSIVNGGLGKVMLIKPSWDSIAAYTVSTDKFHLRTTKDLPDPRTTNGTPGVYWLWTPKYQDDGSFHLFQQVPGNGYLKNETTTLLFGTQYTKVAAADNTNDFKFVLTSALDPTRPLRRGYYTINAKDPSNPNNVLSVDESSFLPSYADDDFVPSYAFHYLLSVPPPLQNSRNMEGLWLIEPISDDYYYITHKNSLLSLVSAGEQSPNYFRTGLLAVAFKANPVINYPGADLNEQVWKIQRLANGKFRLISLANAPGSDKGEIEIKFIKDAMPLFNESIPYSIQYDLEKATTSAGVFSYPIKGISKNVSTFPDRFDTTIVYRDFKYFNQSDLWNLKYVGGNQYNIIHRASGYQMMLRDASKYESLSRDFHVPVISDTSYISDLSERRLSSRFAFFEDHQRANAPAEQGYYYMVPAHDPTMVMRKDATYTPFFRASDQPGLSGETDMVMHPEYDRYPVIDTSKGYMIANKASGNAISRVISIETFPDVTGNGYGYVTLTNSNDNVNNQNKIWKIKQDSLGFYSIIYPNSLPPVLNLPLFQTNLGTPIANLVSPNSPFRINTIAPPLLSGQPQDVIQELTNQLGKFSIEYSGTPGQFVIVSKVFSRIIDTNIVVQRPLADAPNTDNAITSTYDGNIKGRWSFVLAPPNFTTARVAIAQPQVLLNNIPDNRFQIFPTPVSEKLNISLFMKAAGRITVTITDVKGIQVYQSMQSLDKGNGLITLNNLGARNIKSGVYIVKVVSVSGGINEVRKIVVL